MARLSEDEKTVALFVASQTQANVWGAYTYLHFIQGANVPFSHVAGNSRYYRVAGAAVRALLAEIEFKMWVPGTEAGVVMETRLSGSPGDLRP